MAIAEELWPIFMAPGAPRSGVVLFRTLLGLQWVLLAITKSSTNLYFSLKLLLFSLFYTIEWSNNDLYPKNEIIAY